MKISSNNEILTKLSGGFHHKYKNIKEGMDKEPEQSVQALQNNVILRLVSAGLLSKFDVLYLFTPGNEQASTLNYIDISDNILVKELSTAFTETGFKGNAIDSSYMDMDFIPSIDGINYQNTDASLGCFMTSTEVEDHAFLIGYSDGGALDNPASGVINRAYAWQGKANEGTAGYTEKGTCGKNDAFVVAVRNGGDSLLYINGRLVDTKTQVTGTNLLNKQFQIFRNGNGNNPSSNSFGVLFLASKFTASEIINLYDIFHIYLAGLGLDIPDKNILGYLDFEGPTYSNNGYWYNIGVGWDPNYTTTILSGTQSLYVPAGETGFFSFLESGTDTTEISFMIRFDALPSTNNQFLSLQTSAGVALATVKLYNSGRLYLTSGGKNYYDTTILSINTTYYLWLEYVMGAGGDSEFHIYINTSPTKPSGPTGSITGGDETLQIARFNLNSALAQGTNYIFDEILIKEI